MTTRSPSQSAYPWGLLLLEGMISAGVGVALLFMREPTLRLALWLLGLYLVASSLLALGTAVLPASGDRRVWLIARGVLGMLAGLFLLSDRVIPGVRISDLALLSVALVGVLIGLVGLIQAARGAGWARLC